MKKQYIGAIDQGTTSTRFIIFDKNGSIISTDQKEHDQLCRKPGWVEHNPETIWENTCSVIQNALEKARINAFELAAIGVTNQRETIVAWDKTSGKPVYNAIVWQCSRTESICEQIVKEAGKDTQASQDWFRKKTGLPVATYFSGTKIKWIIDNVEKAQELLKKNRLLFGTIDSWIVWNLTGGTDKGIHVTDVTNASRTLLMNIKTLEWDDEILTLLKIPKSTLPKIVSSSDEKAFGLTTSKSPFKTQIPISGVLGDQQAALFGQTCFEAGEAKNTYGTGCFLLFNTGEKPVFSQNGLLTTLAFKIGQKKAVYALEGSIAYAGALIQWVRDNLGFVKQASQIEELAQTVEDNGGVYCVPAFSGLFAPYWRPDARGVIVGLTQFANKGHIARAVIEAAAYQTKDIVDAVLEDLENMTITDTALKSLRVDGGMIHNTLLMQFQSDILDVEVIRPRVAETTALGAAYAAGLAVGFWESYTDLKKNWSVHKTWKPAMDKDQRNTLYSGWKKAVQRTLNWK